MRYPSRENGPDGFTAHSLPNSSFKPFPTRCASSMPLGPSAFPIAGSRVFSAMRPRTLTRLDIQNPVQQVPYPRLTRDALAQ